MSQVENVDGVTLPVEDREAEGGPPAASYLLVFERSSSWIFELPHNGRVLIGRGEGVELRLHDPAISRHHAKVISTPREVLLADLDSQNGTYVNGERLAGTRPLLSGDSFTIGNVTLVFHSRGRHQRARGPVDFTHLRQRLEEECERFQRSHRSFSLVAFHLGKGEVDRAAVALALEPLLHRIDLAAWDGAASLYVLLVETDAEQALERAERLMKALVPGGRKVRVGVASCPGDGCTADDLLMSVRAAIRVGTPGQVELAAVAFQSRAVGEATVLIADPAMTRVYELVERLAAVDLSVLIYGETGTGKELIARALHHWSARRERQLVALNCAAIPEQLVESELFGYERGAFSGAAAAKPGLFEMADGGTVFLDEIGEMPAAAQAKLLRVLETGRLVRIGGLEERRVNLRVVAATYRSLEREVSEGRFREDLFFRLRGATVWLPPLRDRPRELALLAQRFLADTCDRIGRPPLKITDEAMQGLAAYRWPGNIRELKNFIDYVVAVEPGGELTATHLSGWLGAKGGETRDTFAVPGELKAAPASQPGAPAPAAATTLPTSGPGAQTVGFRPVEEELRELERNRMAAALAAAGGNQTRAAELISMPRRTFATKMKLYNLTGVGKP
ncbi:MAG TPA: sigma 54-interacting transcriptional regulator [Polyangia bacterium]|jgi:DNA-binding NtrC family response regulator|nr:sigma 54-interacting transcriptional regulator [Polyangia bacterium]